MSTSDSEVPDRSLTTKYLMVDPRLQIPDRTASREEFPLQIAHCFVPDIDTRFHHYGTKIQERLIFCLEGDYNEKEEQSLEDLEEYLEENEIELSDFFNTYNKLRFLQANKYKIEQTADNMVLHDEFRHENLPFKITPGMSKVLQSGLMYVHGRDRHFRPIFIIQANVLNQLKVEPDDAIRASMFVAMYAIEYLMLPGKVENWTILCDLANLSIGKIPISFLKNFMKTMQSHLKCRGRIFMVLQVTLAIRMIWRTLSPFLDDRIKKKIMMTKDAHHPKIDEMIHPAQLEERYGGDAPNLTEFWPPQHISDEYGYDHDMIDENEVTIQGEPVHHDDRASHEVSVEQSHRLPTYTSIKKKTTAYMNGVELEGIKVEIEQSPGVSTQPNTNKSKSPVSQSPSEPPIVNPPPKNKKVKKTSNGCCSIF